MDSYLTSLSDARVSLHSFLLGLFLTVIDEALFGALFQPANYVNFILHLMPHLFLCVAYCVIIAVLTNLFFPQVRHSGYFDNGIRAFGLGIVCSLGCTIVLYTPYKPFGVYLSILTIFHWSEYYVTAVSNPDNLTLDSYMLNHSLEYTIAAIASWCEYWIEVAVFPWSFKYLPLVSSVGLMLCISGEILRKAAILTARSNFNHYVQYVRRNGHVLVTNGVYGYFRHPSYVGWFYWAVGTQIILCNPFCLMAYMAASWFFFKERIHEEERALLSFFGEDYLNYQNTVPTGLPFIKGYTAGPVE